MRVAVVFDPDETLGVDPLDEHKTPRAQGLWLDDEKVDVLLVWREVGDQFRGGSRTHVISGGVWENITEEQTTQLLGWLNDDGLEDGA